VRDKIQKEEARVRAEAYAPAPKDSRLLYAVIAVALLLLLLAAVGGFYAIDVWQHPFIIAALTCLAAAGGLASRFWRSRRHNIAHRDEYHLGARVGDR
jgi:protein-S-isoprenylcysteine O-methyltransferase Ste14